MVIGGPAGLFTQVIVINIRQRRQGLCQGAAMSARTYRLEAEGELSDQLRPVFEGMSLTRAHGNTVLVGTVRDQAELFGLLQRFADLGLTLVSVVSIEEQAER
jgi:hypothetical protein